MNRLIRTLVLAFVCLVGSTSATFLFYKEVALAASPTIIMLAPAANSSFSTPSGNVYASSPQGLIVNVVAADQASLQQQGCVLLTPRNNVSATRAPLDTDDFTASYGVGSIWVDIASSVPSIYALTAMTTTPGSATWTAIAISSGTGGIAYNNSMLSSYASGTFVEVTRLGFAAPGDDRPLNFIPSASPCSLNSGAGDGGSQVPSSDGKCFLAIFPSGNMTPEDFGLVGDGGYVPGVLLTSGSNAISGFSFPAEAVTNHVPVVCYGCGTNGGNFNSTVLDATHFNNNVGVTIGAYAAKQAWFSTAYPTTAAPLTIGDVLTVSDSRVTCAGGAYPEFTINKISGPDASLGVTQAGDCSVLPPGGPTTQIAVTSSGSGSKFSVWVNWYEVEYLSGVGVDSGGTGYASTTSFGVAGVTCAVPPVITGTAVGGVVATLVIATNGQCSVAPGFPGRLSSAVALTGGSGTGATAYIVFNSAGAIAFGTDNYTGFNAIAAAILAAGGGTLNFKPNAAYALRTSLPSPSDSFDEAMNFAPTIPLNGLNFEGNGATIIDARHYTAGNSVGATSSFIQVVGNPTAPITGVRVHGLNLLQAEPGGHLIVGAFLLAVGGTVINTEMLDNTISSGLTYLNCSAYPSAGSARAHGFSVLGGFAFNTEYGINMQNNCDDGVIKGFFAFEPGRIMFPYGVSNWDIQVTIQDPLTEPTFLYVANYGTNLPLRHIHTSANIRMTVGGDLSDGTYIQVLPAHAGFTGGTLDDLLFDVTYDASNDVGSTLLSCSKSGVVNAGSTWSNIRLTGSVFGIQTNTPNTSYIINCPDNTDTNWSNETFLAGNKFGPLSMTGSSYPGNYSDLGGFTATNPLVMEDVGSVGAWQFPNIAGNLIQRNFTNAGAWNNPGNLLSASAALGSVSLASSGSAYTITSLSLTPGVWDVICNPFFSPANTTTITRYQGSISTATNTLTQTFGRWFDYGQEPSTPGNNANISFITPPYRVSVATPTSYYCVAEGAFTVSTMTAGGIMEAREVQ